MKLIGIYKTWGETYSNAKSGDEIRLPDDVYTCPKIIPTGISFSRNNSGTQGWFYLYRPNILERLIRFIKRYFR